MSRLELLLRTEPAIFANFLAVAATLIAAFAFTVTQNQEAAIVVISTAVITVLVSALARPVQVPLLVGAVVTGLTAAAAFGLKVQPEVLASFSAALTTVLTLMIRGHVTPLAAKPAPV